MGNDKFILDLCVVEDDEFDQEFLRRGLRPIQDNLNLRFFATAEEFLEFCRKEQGGASTKGRLLFLDINLPVMSGLDLLEEIRSDQELSHLLVFIVSSSDAPQDLKRAYQAGVSGYIKKSDLQGNLEELRTLLEFYRTANIFL